MVSVIWLRSAMEKAGFTTQKALAEAAEVSAATISTALKRKTVRKDVAIKLQKACLPFPISPNLNLGLSLGDIFSSAFARGERYQLKVGRYTAMVGIYNGDDFLVRSTFSLEDEDWREQAESRVEQFNADGETITTVEK